MRTKFGVVFMLLGSILILGALGLFFYNTQEEKQATNHSTEMVGVLQEEIRHVQETLPDQPDLLDSKPLELLTEEDLVMTEKTIKGHAYIGYLSIPALELELPVMSQWSNQKLQISPCRYSGTLRGRDLVIMAHSYASHFGRLSSLSAGAEVTFTDMDGNIWEYEIAVMDVLDAYAVEEMVAGDYDLTLFTCTKDRAHRVTVRCNRIEK